ncbi:DUF4381 domain-containing protein [Pseudoroseomonas ludipueritiae]|uniref:DUF4381 domain-containing protein n=1 Tax=Pseudoroseomonas ludipueritiae TaxID=198093 RepID=A0ABR7R1V0_9PROT|nr:DUF4381 domain-containing protein [Pseudoroseomonas ludipueritiae]
MNPDLPPMPSLEKMQDILLPPPVPLWPATPAWAFLGLLLLGLLLAFLWRMWRRWRRDAWRRAARHAVEEASARGDWAALPALIKRAALAAHPRSEVAALSGEAWAAWLNRSAPRARLRPEEARALAMIAYRPAAAELALAAARRWLEFHDRAG